MFFSNQPWRSATQRNRVVSKEGNFHSLERFLAILLWMVKHVTCGIQCRLFLKVITVSNFFIVSTIKRSNFLLSNPQLLIIIIHLKVRRLSFFSNFKLCGKTETFRSKLLSHEVVSQPFQIDPVLEQKWGRKNTELKKKLKFPRKCSLCNFHSFG